MDTKETAEASAARAFERIKLKHGARAVVIIPLIAMTELAMAKLKLSPDECKTVVGEIQASLDGLAVFRSKN